jgi:negative regulator of sigma-B (phosphoserine phosphatase)
MPTRQVSPFPLIEWGVAARVCPGQAVSGDAYVVKLFPTGILVAVVDGLGHGEAAKTAAKLAIATLDGCDSESVKASFQRCHEILGHTRGVVMTVAFIHAFENAIRWMGNPKGEGNCRYCPRSHLTGSLTWLGVGNVEGVLFRTDAFCNAVHERASLMGGTVGGLMPPLQPRVLSLMRGDLLVLATDGVESGFTKGLSLDQPAQRIVDGIMEKHYKQTDDALVLAVRFLGMPDE